MPQLLSSDTVTEDVRVFAEAWFLKEQSKPGEESFVFAYRIVLTNEGSRRVKLLSRHWIIINGDGDREEVRGRGVVGKTPSLAPGDTFEYTSFCPLDTEWGTMEGTYQMQREDGVSFDAVIGRFFLAANAPQPAEAV
ncbi:MAG: Co2+/Mg2+ efflux protein ApaG [Ignavibacteriae bacterium]|nr:Co2+/Mg2+ efflux protein ApaG [Ignavibacteriota bacterium]